jgi:F-type H+-transporting ATPase subunit b
MEAWAAETAAHASEPFYANATFWVGVGFVLFVGLISRIVYRVVTVALDDRAERIRNQIDEATRVAEEARELLASYERKQREAADEAKSIVEHARHEAARLSESAAQDLERSLARRRKQAEDRIAQAEASAIADVRNRAIEVAMDATQRLLSEKIKGKSADDLIDAAIKEIPKNLH